MTSYRVVMTRFPTFSRSDGVKQLLVPVPRCRLCYKPIKKQYEGGTCYSCGIEPAVDGTILKRIVAATLYIPKVSGYAHNSELLRLKEQGALANEYAEVLEHVLQEEKIISKFGLIVPVPPTRPRSSLAGPYALARALSARVGIRYQEALSFTREVRTQKGLSAEERRKNVTGAMKATGVVSGQACLAVDDICTTGSSLREAARAIVEAGGRWAYGAAAGRDADLEGLAFAGVLEPVKEAEEQS